MPLGHSRWSESLGSEASWNSSFLSLHVVYKLQACHSPPAPASGHLRRYFNIAGFYSYANLESGLRLELRRRLGFFLAFIKHSTPRESSIKQLHTHHLLTFPSHLYDPATDKVSPQPFTFLVS